MHPKSFVAGVLVCLIFVAFAREAKTLPKASAAIGAFLRQVGQDNGPALALRENAPVNLAPSSHALLTRGVDVRLRHGTASIRAGSSVEVVRQTDDGVIAKVAGERVMLPVAAFSQGPEPLFNLAKP